MGKLIEKTKSSCVNCHGHNQELLIGVLHVDCTIESMTFNLRWF